MNIPHPLYSSMIHGRLDGFFKLVVSPACRLLLQCDKVFGNVQRILELISGSHFIRAIFSYMVVAAGILDKLLEMCL